MRLVKYAWLHRKEQHVKTKTMPYVHTNIIFQNISHIYHFCTMYYKYFIVSTRYVLLHCVIALILIIRYFLSYSYYIYSRLLTNTHPSAQVVLHSPLCNCKPFAHDVQFIRDTHCVHVCKHFAQMPASMK